MTAGIDQAMRKATFAFFAKDAPVLVNGNPYWIDSGAHGLNARQLNFTAPAYGKALNVRNRPYLGFAGLEFCNLPLRFYNDAPTNGLTMVLMAEHLDPVQDDIIFDCVDPVGGVTGVRLYYQADDVLELLAYDAGGATMTVTDTAALPLSDRTLVSVAVLNQTAGLGEMYHDGLPNGTFAGSTNPIAYTATATPTIGASSGGQSGTPTVNIYALLMFPWAFSCQEVKWATRHLWDWVW